VYPASPVVDNGEGLVGFSATRTHQSTPAQVLTNIILRNFQQSHIGSSASLPAEESPRFNLSPNLMHLTDLEVNLLMGFNPNEIMAHDFDVVGDVPPSAPVNSISASSATANTASATQRRSLRLGGATQETVMSFPNRDLSIRREEEEVLNVAQASSTPQASAPLAEPVSPSSVQSGASAVDDDQDESVTTSAVSTSASTLPSLQGLRAWRCGPPGRYRNGNELMEAYLYKAPAQVRNLILSLVIRALREKAERQHVGPGAFDWESWRAFGADSLRSIMFEVMDLLHQSYRIPQFRRNDHNEDLARRSVEQWRHDMDVVMRWQNLPSPNYSRLLTAHG
jgi:hypothetical protein